MHFEYLSDRPEAIAKIARWYSEEWGHLSQARTYEGFVEQLQEYLVADQMPLMILAVEADEVIGVAQLKYHEIEDVYPDLVNWAGGIYVDKSYRGHRIGTALVEEILRIAPRFGIRKLFLQTEALDGGLYAKLGWKPREIHQGPRVQTLIMEKSIGADRSAK